MTRFFHRLLNPHCAECISAEDKVIDILRTLLENEKREKQQLLESILHKDEPVQIVRNEPTNKVSVPRGHTPWRVRQQLLEQEDRATAAAVARNNKIEPSQVEELEKELGVDNG